MDHVENTFSGFHPSLDSSDLQKIIHNHSFIYVFTQKIHIKTLLCDTEAFVLNHRITMVYWLAITV